ncbi:hypothetical protein JCM16303_004574 [Sporobolomyces ruberrimus]
MPRRSHIAVKLARNATPKDLVAKLGTSYGATAKKTSCLEVPFGSVTAQLEVYTIKTLPIEIRNWIWTLFQSNMKGLFEASIDGYDPKEKRKELFHTESRFFVLRSTRTSKTAEDQAVSLDDLLGFSIFRFDTEETAGEEKADVVYCYELHCEVTARGKGVGSVLMDSLERIGRETKMDKVMLTVLKSNHSAIAFYERSGLTVDEIDPSYYEEGDESEPVDYTILSKSITL